MNGYYCDDWRPNVLTATGAIMKASRKQPTSETQRPQWSTHETQADRCVRNVVLSLGGGLGMIILAVVVAVGMAAAAHGATIAMGATGHQGCASTITKGDITWTLAKWYPAGQFADGSWWICPRGDDPNSPIITAITPEQVYTDSDPNTLRNGSYVNPPVGNVQWIDGRGAYRDPNYNETLPLTLDPNSTLLSSRSLVAGDLDPNSDYYDVTGVEIVNNSNYNTYVKDIQFLTCLPSKPAGVYYRPPYVGTAKPLEHLASACDWNSLPNLTAEPNEPAVATIATWFANPWTDHINDGSQNRAMHAADNMPNYGREVCWNLGDALLMLCCSHTAAEKQSIGVGIVQYGIDLEAIVAADPNHFEPLAGQSIGRMPVVVFAGHMLGDSGMLGIGATAKFHENMAYFGPLGDPNYQDYPLEGSLWTGWGSGDPNLGDPNYQTDVMWIYQSTWTYEGTPIADWDQSPPAQNTPGPSSQWPFEKHELYRRLCMKAMPGEALAMLILDLDSHFRPPYFYIVARTLFEDDSLARAAMAAQAVTDSWNSLRVGALDFESAASYSPALGPGEVLYSPFATDMVAEFWATYWPY